MFVFLTFSAQDGPFFLGNELSMLEIAIMPFLGRFYALLPYYRKIDLFQEAKIPGDLMDKLIVDHSKLLRLLKKSLCIQLDLLFLGFKCGYVCIVFWALKCIGFRVFLTSFGMIIDICYGRYFSMSPFSRFHVCRNMTGLEQAFSEASRRPFFTETSLEPRFYIEFYKRYAVGEMAIQPKSKMSATCS